MRTGLKLLEAVIYEIFSIISILTYWLLAHHYCTVYTTRRMLMTAEALLLLLLLLTPLLQLLC